MGWYEVADELWDQSAQLNAERDDHPLCGGAVSRLGARGETTSSIPRASGTEPNCSRHLWQADTP
jgi:hypothetical protein